MPVSPWGAFPGLAGMCRWDSAAGGALCARGCPPPHPCPPGRCPAASASPSAGLSALLPHGARGAPSSVRPAPAATHAFWAVAGGLTSFAPFSQGPRPALPVVPHLETTGSPFPFSGFVWWRFRAGGSVCPFDRIVITGRNPTHAAFYWGKIHMKFSFLTLLSASIPTDRLQSYFHPPTLTVSPLNPDSQALGPALGAHRSVSCVYEPDSPRCLAQVPHTGAMAQVRFPVCLAHFTSRMSQGASTCGSCRGAPPCSAGAEPCPVGWLCCRPSACSPAGGRLACFRRWPLCIDNAAAARGANVSSSPAFNSTACARPSGIAGSCGNSVFDF